MSIFTQVLVFYKKIFSNCPKYTKKYNRSGLQQGAARTEHPKKSSNYTGVCFSGGRFLSRIGKNGKTYHLGSFKTEKEAAKAYNRKARQLYGPGAKLNIIE